MILTGLIFFFSLPLWVMIVEGLRTLNQNDPAGRGLAVVYVIGGTFVLWILLAVALIGAGNKGLQPAWVNVAALLLHPASCAASVAVVYLLDKRDTVRWMIVVPALAPILMLLYCAWLSFPALRAHVPSAPMCAGVWGAVLVLSLMPWPRVAMLSGIQEKRRAERRLIVQQREAEYQSLNVESPLSQYLRFIQAGQDFRDDAMNKARQLQRRQKDAEALLAAGDDSVLLNLTELDLQPTMRLRVAASKILEAKAHALHHEVTKRKYPEVEEQFDWAMRALEWLVEHGSTVKEEAEIFRASAESYNDYHASLFLKRLEDLPQSGK